MWDVIRQLSRLRDTFHFRIFISTPFWGGKHPTLALPSTRVRDKSRIDIGHTRQHPPHIMIIILATSLLLISVWLILNRSRPSRKIPLPPGPPADPLIGHLRIIPPKHTDVFFYELSKKYGMLGVFLSGITWQWRLWWPSGKVLSLQIPGKTLVVLNSAKAAIDLLDKRSAIYSDRAVSTMMLLYVYFLYVILSCASHLLSFSLGWGGGTTSYLPHMGGSAQYIENYWTNALTKKNVVLTRHFNLSKQAA